MIISVLMITYGHGKFIEKAIDSILSQKTIFDIELIIADDNSPDNTEEIVNDIIKRHPNGSWIKYTKHKQNKGIQFNFLWATQQCSGKYIAFCEGDDYWIDNFKLQKQIDFLESNSDYSVCFHNVNFISENDTLIEGYIDKDNSTFYVEDCYKGTFMPTASVVCRAINGFPVELFNNIPYGDWAVQMHSLYKGKGYCFKERMANYRFHAGGVHSNLSALIKLKNKTLCYREFYSYFKMTEEQRLFFGHFYSKSAWTYFFSSLNQRKIWHIYTSVKYLLSIKEENNLIKILLHIFRIKRMKEINV